MITKICSKCQIEKDITLFGTSLDKRKGKTYSLSKCFLCKAEYDKEYRANLDKVKVKEYNKKYRENNSDNIAVCKKQHRDKNKDFYYNYNKQYYTKNKINILDQKKLYYINNKRLILDSHIIYTKKRLKTDSVFKLRRNVSRLVHFYLLKNNSSKNKISIIKFLPYTMQELKIHLEAQFEPWMNWENYGTYRVDIWDDTDPTTWTWQIDHIVPHSKFKYLSMEDQEFKDCWALTNLRPYSSKQNVIDGDRK